MRNEKGNILVIVLAGFLLLAIGAAGYFFWQNQQLQNVPSNQYPTNSNQVNSPTPSTQDETVNWKTFQSSSAPFTFKYPVTSEWKLFDTTDSSGPAVAVTCEQCASGNMDLFQAIQSPKYWSIDQYLTQDILTTDKSKFMLGNIEAVRGVQSGSEQAGGSSLVIYAVYNNKGYLITQRFPKALSKTRVNEFPKASPDILSTFKFLADNSKQTASTKTYVNQYYKFKIDYPGDWTAFEQNISNNPQQGNLAISSPEAAQGVLTIYWGGGFGGGPCPKERQKVQTNAGIIDMCKNVYDDGSVNLSRSNDGIGDTFDDKASPALNFTISLKSTADEQKILNVLKTFTWQ